MASTDYVQTLEPRAYYVYVPYEKQDMLPNFDTAQAPFSFTQMFMENRFFGNDRIGDANQVTLALTSRLLEADSGSERLRASVAALVTVRETPLTSFRVSVAQARRGLFSRRWAAAGNRPATRRWSGSSLCWKRKAAI